MPGGFKLFRRNFFTERVIKHRNELPREGAVPVTESLSLEGKTGCGTQYHDQVNI